MRRYGVNRSVHVGCAGRVRKKERQINHSADQQPTAVYHNAVSRCATRQVIVSVSGDRTQTRHTWYEMDGKVVRVQLQDIKVDSIAADYRQDPDAISFVA